MAKQGRAGGSYAGDEVLAGRITARHQIGDRPSPGVQAGARSSRCVSGRGFIDSGGGRCDYPGLRTALRGWAFGAWRDHSYAGGAARTVRVTVPEGGSPWPYGSSCLHLRCGLPGLPPGWVSAGTV
jgi:hypothetical protein